MAFKNPIVAGLTLVRDAIQSSNFITQVSGWRITKLGGAEFNDVLIRGELSQGDGTTMSIRGNTTNGFYVYFGTGSSPTYVQMYATASQSALSLRPTGPNGSYINGYVLASYINDALASRQGTLEIKAPSQGGPYTGFYMLSEAQDGSISNKITAYASLFEFTGNVTINFGSLTTDAIDVDDLTVTADATIGGTLDVTGNVQFLGNANIDGTLRLGSGNQEIGQGVRVGASSTANFATIAEAVSLTSASETFYAGRCYRIVVYGMVANATAGAQTTLRVKKGNTTGGTQYLDSRVACITAGLNYNAATTGHFVVNGSNVTTQLCLTVQSGGAGNGTHIGAATMPRGFYVEDIGSSANPAFTGIPAMV